MYTALVFLYGLRSEVATAGQDTYGIREIDCMLQVNFPEGSCMTNIGNKRLELLQFHFHTPSEHMLNTKRCAMEAHLVHREVGTQELTVLGVMMQRGPGAQSNPCLRKALDYAPAPGGKVC